MAVIFSLQRAPKTHCSPKLDDGIYLAGKGSKAILLIHGLTGSPSEMAFIARSFHKQGYTVYIPRIVGHGDSIFVLKKRKWQDFYESMRVAFEKLRADCNPETSLFVGGLSMGALLALLLAEEYGEAVSGVISFSATLFFDGWNVPWTHRLLPIAFYTPLKHCFYFQEESPYGLKNETVRRHVHASYSDMKLADYSDAAKNGYAFFPVALFCELQKLIRHLLPRLSRLFTPILLLQAREDDMTSPRNSDYIHKRVASKINKLVLLDNCFHVITADQERYLVAETSIDFCEQIAETLSVSANAC